MKLKNLRTVLFFAAVLGLASCQKEPYNNDPIQSEWLLPLMKSSVKPLTLTRLNNRHFSDAVELPDLGPMPSFSPIPLAFHDIGPFELETTDLVLSAELETCLADLKVTNNFPVALEPGTKITVATPDGSGGTVVIATAEFSKGIAVGLRDSLELDLSGKTIGDKLLISISEITIAPYEDLTFGGGLDFDMHIKTVTVKSVSVIPGREYVLRDTSDFDGSGLEFEENGPNIRGDVASAKMTFDATNQMPVNLNFQVSFLDDSGAVLHSLFASDAKVAGADYAAGVLVGEKKSALEANVSEIEIAAIKKATKVAYELRLDTHGYTEPSVTVSRGHLLAMKLVGNVNLVLRSSEF